MSKHPCRRLSAAVGLFVLSLAGSSSANVFNMPAGQTSLQFVPIGNPGNPHDPLTGYGRVNYTYSMGKFEVTVGQYTCFLNAVAATDTYGLYDPSMATSLNVAGITRDGLPGSYVYSVIGSPNRPVALVGWGSAARLANWLTNGQPTGPQGPNTTEAGSYALNGATSSTALQAVIRAPNARYMIPTENEWYKAAYHDPGRGGSNYWLYPMRTDGPIFSAGPPGTDAPNAALAANFWYSDGIANGYDDGYALTGSLSWSGSINYLSDVGAYPDALSHYGTLDQGGNLMEWTERLNPSIPLGRGLRGGSWKNPADSLRATGQGMGQPVSTGKDSVGLRIVLLPEPATVVLMGVAGLLLRPRRRTRGT